MKETVIQMTREEFAEFAESLLLGVEGYMDRYNDGTETWAIVCGYVGGILIGLFLGWRLL